MFKTNLKDLGKVKVGQKLDITFEAEGTLPDVVRLNASCGCSQAHHDVKNNRIVVVYIPKGIPVHLKDQGFYTSTKQIKVTFKGGETELLTFKAQVYAD